MSPYGTDSKVHIPTTTVARTERSIHLQNWFSSLIRDQEARIARPLLLDIANNSSWGRVNLKIWFYKAKLFDFIKGMWPQAPASSRGRWHPGTWGAWPGATPPAPGCPGCSSWSSWWSRNRALCSSGTPLLLRRPRHQMCRTLCTGSLSRNQWWPPAPPTSAWWWAGRPWPGPPVQGYQISLWGGMPCNNHLKAASFSCRCFCHVMLSK